MQNGGKGSLSLKLLDCGMTSLGGGGNKGRVAVSHLHIPKTQLLAEQINLWLARRGQPCLCLLIGQNSDFLFTSSFWKEVIFGRLLSAFSASLRLVANNSLCNCAASLRKVVLGHCPGPHAPVVDTYVTIFIFLQRAGIRHCEEQRI